MDLGNGALDFAVWDDHSQCKQGVINHSNHIVQSYSYWLSMFIHLAAQWAHIAVLVHTH